MTLSGTRFGDIEVDPNDILTFPEGLIGFTSTTRFILLQPKADSTFHWLQSLDEASIAFLVAEPFQFVPDYQVQIDDEHAAVLDLNDDDQPAVLTTVNIPHGKPEEMTINLAGPLIVNPQTRLGCQVVLEDEAYTIRHRVFQRADRVSESVAA